MFFYRYNLTSKPSRKMKNQCKHVLLKTYSKKRRVLSPWIAIENRKQIFDSPNLDLSTNEKTKPTGIREESSSFANRGRLRPARRKAVVRQMEDSDEENKSNVYISSPSPRPCLTQQNTPARKSKIVTRPGRSLRRKALKFVDTSESEVNSISDLKHCKIAVQRKNHSVAAHPSHGRFVTRHKQTLTSKPELHENPVFVFSSSDDSILVQGSCGNEGIPQPSKQSAPGALIFSSAENSVNDPGNADSTTNLLFRESSLDESPDQSIEAYPRKPLLCSTPSNFPLYKQPHVKSSPIQHQPSILMSHIVFSSSSQEDSGPPRDPFSPSPAASVKEPIYGGKQVSTLGEPQKDQSTHQCEKPPDSLAVKRRSMTRNMSIYEGDKSQNEGTEIQGDETNGSSHFLSATAGLEWLLECHKMDCLSKHCTVQLKRLDEQLVALLLSQTTYSSSLDYLSSFESWQESDHSWSVEGGQTSDPPQKLDEGVTSSDAPNHSQLLDSGDSIVPVYSAGEGLTSNSLPSVFFGCLNNQTTNQEEFSGHPLSEVTNTSVVHIDSFVPISDTSGIYISETQSRDYSCCINKTQCTDPETGKKMAALTAMLKEKCPTVKCMVQLKKLFSSQGSEDTATAFTDTLKLKCLDKKCKLKVKRDVPSQLTGTLQLKNKTQTLSTDISSSDGDGQSASGMKNSHQSEQDNNAHVDGLHNYTVSRNTFKKKSPFAHLEGAVGKSLGSPCDVPIKKRKDSQILKGKRKKKSMSQSKSRINRKACVSGLDMSRWKNKGNRSTHAHQSQPALRGDFMARDCSFTELLSTQDIQPNMFPENLLHGASVVSSTPLRASLLDVSLLTDFTPGTRTWSRLKAAISVHRKTKVSLTLTPGRLPLSDVRQELFATPLQTSIPKHFVSQLHDRDSLAMCKDTELSDAEKVYAECGQQGPLPWEECILPQHIKRCRKIGEGAFGEVFSTTNTSGKKVALKIIPVEGSDKVNGEDQKTFGEILHEIIISKELSSLKEKQHNQTCGFIGLNDLHCVRGCYPPALLKVWDAFDQQKGSENDRPDFFEKEQLFLILEFEFGGSDLENSNGSLASFSVAKSILHQVTAALAVAEQEFNFEHRDLHWGNVLVKATTKKKESYLLNGVTHSLDTRGVFVSIIDYSLSRLEIDGLTVSCDISEDEELFMGQGDYQFDIYRLMRHENRNNWIAYHPHSNVLWLHYLCSKLLLMKYRRNRARAEKDTKAELTHFHANLLQYRSATEVLQNCPLFQFNN